MDLNIAVLSGDGIGPEVTNEAVKVIDVISKKFDHKVNISEGLTGAIAIDKKGNPYPDETHQICEKSDAVLFGAIGDPKYDNDPSAKVRPEQGLLEMRKKLDLYANLRPTIVFESLINNSPLKKDRIQNTDLIFVRELTGGIYFGERGRKDNGNFAYDTCEYNRHEVERIAQLGFEMALKRKRKLCCVDKANVLESSRLWRETVQNMESRFPDVKVSYEFVDAVAMRLIQWPSKYDVLVTSNLFGDILTDEASVISGSMGLMPSASIGAKNALYEPIHGSFPQAAGKNIANPIGSILSLAMMFEHSFNLEKESNIIKQAVQNSLKEKITTQDITGNDKSYTTSDVGDFICNNINSFS